ncbi:glutathione hydrolase 5 proenzyme isoform X1 [Cheilinus undulatus]|uniref:glutathione hydrolase 5 proenzyme isoform X1 n=1 Tax=Cheilinus undulatus TaxID=241271 RepID=UPI001BD6B613|nr:glutathione hydrolase 5 proenzyme isoform X1 [Cheilinus undulatus]
MARCKPWLVCCSTFVCLVCTAALVCFFIFSFLDRGCPNGSFKHAAVAADSLRCSQIGRKMLQEGGSAVDGAIAALLCTSVINPQSMGIGGGSVFTIREKTGKVKVFNFRETVPKAFKSNLLNDCPTTSKMTTGTQWIGVPGELRGYEDVHRRYGKLPWAKLFEPTIKLAREGIPLPPYLGLLLNIPLAKKHVEKSSLCEVLCNKNKTVLGKGDMLKFPKLAESMEMIAAQGAKAFYTGKIGHDLIQDIKDAGGTMEVEDLESFRVRVADAWTVPLGDAKLHIAPPPAGGALLAFILKLLEGFSLTPDSFHGDQKIQTYHLFIEAAKFANGQKRNIHDPDFNDRKSADHLIDPTFIDHIRKMISSNRTHENSYYNVKPSTDHFGTTHVSVLDEDGLAVSATSTINHLFGGAVYSPRTGIILNNELSDFCKRADTLTAGEQPPSSMTPVILESKSGGLLVIGGSGGSMITVAVALVTQLVLFITSFKDSLFVFLHCFLLFSQSIMNHLWLGMNLTEAIAAPIVYIDPNNNLNFERFMNHEKFDQSVKDGLLALGHKQGDSEYFVNVVNAVEKENGCIVAVSDSRKLGMSDGY